MAWSSRRNHDPADVDVDDEASLGLIASKSESVARPPSTQRRPWISNVSLSIVLVLSNLAWAGLCLLLWHQLYISRIATQLSHKGFEADFGIITSDD